MEYKPNVLDYRGRRVVKDGDKFICTREGHKYIVDDIRKFKAIHTRLSKGKSIDLDEINFANEFIFQPSKYEYHGYEAWRDMSFYDMRAFRPIGEKRLDNTEHYTTIEDIQNKFQELGEK